MRDLDPIMLEERTQKLEANNKEIKKDIAELSKKITQSLKTVTFSHSYSVQSNDEVNWNPKDDGIFDVEGYKPLGIVGYATNTLVHVLNLKAADSVWACYLHNPTNSPINNKLDYFVLYEKL